MNKPRLLFVHTGGTIVMKGDHGPLQPVLQDVLSYARGLEELVEVEGLSLCNVDSSDMTPEHWELIAGTVAEHRGDFDGFVILHGTDTMAYSASAVSYLLHQLDRPVVFTGSQRPIADLRTDARLNLVHASICATLDVPEVGIYFGDHLFRGNRTTKVSVQSYNAYASPSLPALVEMGVDVAMPTTCRRPKGRFQLRRGFERDVAVLTVFPGMPADTLRRVVDAGARAVVLSAFGAGNLPLDGWPEAIAESGVPIIVGTQCLHGTVELGRYAGSKAALDAGALSAGNLTQEATLTKTMFLLAQDVDFRAGWAMDLAGELSGA
jgi:L-asparaginase